MNEITIRVILKSGAEFSIKCEKFTLTRNGLQQVTGYEVNGITENKPVYLDFGQVAAVVRVLSDEQPDGGKRKRKAERNIAFTETKTQCPLCGGENENAIIYADKENGEYFVYCDVCKVETIETYKSAAALKAFAEGKTKSIAGGAANE